MSLLNHFRRIAMNGLVVAGLLLSTAAPAFAQTGSGPRPERDLPQWVLDNKLEEPLVEEGVTKLSPSLRGISGRVDVVVRLKNAPTAVIAILGAASAEQLTRSASLTGQQNAVVDFARGLDANVRVLGQTRVVLNAVMLNIDAAALAGLAAHTSVATIRSVTNYTMDSAENAAAAMATVMETVPYIGASPEVQAKANGGAGVKVAVLDSGIDYTHVAFGGAGTLAAYQAAFGTSTADPLNTTRDGLFPTARVVEGYDFVGESWPNGPLTPDDDPIACGQSGINTGTCDGTHGTHVADIIGGAGGVAPNVDLYAVKICSSVSTSCSGVAIIQGLEYAADPNGDGDTSDHVNIVNMSLGSSFGQAYDDDSSLASNNLTDIGVLVVASAGNSADRPYIVGTPSAAYRALSVAQTAVPSDFVQLLTSPLLLNPIGMNFQPWSAALTAPISAVLRYDTTNNATKRGCTTSGASPWVGTPLAGQIVLVDRGDCNISLKVSNAAAAGALVTIIANNAAGTVPPSFSFGGGVPSIPGFSVTQAAGLTLRTVAAAAGTVSVDPSQIQYIVGSVVGTSSRGPNIGQMFYGNNIMYGQLIKPEIGAPGASVSAVAGSGTGVSPFGGTSGAAPMVSGAAALLRAYTWKTGQLAAGPLELKSWLMNTAETNILNGPAIFGGTIAPITRIGGGEVRVDRALDSQVMAYELNNRAAALSFGMFDVARTTVTLRRTVVVRNMSDRRVDLAITPTFRFASDAANGAVKITAPASISVPKRTSTGFTERRFTVVMTIDGTKLPAWSMNSGSRGGNGDYLTAMEYDGYINLTDATTPANNVHLAWQVLPRQAGDVRPTASKVVMGGTSTQTLGLFNKGVALATVDAYSLIGTNPFAQAANGVGMQAPIITLKGIGTTTIPVPAGFCSASPSFLMLFAINTYERQTHANYPAEYDLYLDTNRDGTADYVVYNSENGGFAASGQNLTRVFRLATGTTTAFFYTDHATNSGNTVFIICGEQIGMNQANAGQLINVDAYAFDNYFTGNLTSYIEGMTTSVLAERYMSFGNDIAAGVTEAWDVYDFGANGTTETGLLYVLDADRGTRSGAPANNEALQIPVLP